MCTEKEIRRCRFSSNPNPEQAEIVDTFQNKNFHVNCAVETLLDNPEIWKFWVDYTYNDKIKDLDTIPILQSFIIQSFKEDRESMKEVEAQNGTK